MSESAAGATSLASSASQDTSSRPSQGPNRDKRKPRKTYQGPPLSMIFFLTADRLKPQGPNDKQPKQAPRQQRPPPGLFAPKEPISNAEQKPEEEEDPDSELCFICGNSMKGRYYSISPCNNAFCHNCSLRLRALYKSTNCPFCKVLSPPMR
jgi:E3 ubiquitin-protein ligase ZNF598